MAKMCIEKHGLTIQVRNDLGDFMVRVSITSWSAANPECAEPGAVTLDVPTGIVMVLMTPRYCDIEVTKDEDLR